MTSKPQFPRIAAQKATDGSQKRKALHIAPEAALKRLRRGSIDIDDVVLDHGSGDKSIDEELSAAEYDAWNGSDNDEFSELREFQRECEEYAMDDIRFACREGKRTFLIQQVAHFDGESQTQMLARQDALRRFNQGKLARLEVMASPKPYARAGPGASKEEKIAAYKQDLSHIDVSILMVDYDCREMRRRFNRLLNAKVFSRGEFGKVLGCSAASLSGFLKDEAWVKDCKVFINGWDWFKQREIAGLAMPV